MSFFEDRTPETIKRWNEDTWLVMDRGTFFVCKAIKPEDLQLYKTLVEVNSPYIAHVYDVTVLEDRLSVVQEYVQGETLEEYLQEYGPLTEAEVFQIVLEVLDGLAQMHEKGIVHRDLTPKNIIMTRDKHVKVIDFGISRVEKQGASKDTEFLGTAGFAAPEQYGFRQTSPRTDIYAVGVLMNYMLTLNFPNEELATGKLRPVIQKCTKMDESDRYQTVEDVQRSLILLMNPEARQTASKKKMDHPNAIPGYRYNILWVNVLASIYYVIAGLIVLGSCFIGAFSLYERIISPVVFALILLAPIPILFNYRNWLEKFPMTKGRSLGAKILWQVLGCILIGVLILVLVPTTNI